MKQPAMTQPELKHRISHAAVCADRAPALAWRAARAMRTATWLEAMTLLMFGPLAFGAVQSWSMFVLQMGAAALLMTWGAAQQLEPQMTLRFTGAMVPLCGFVLLVAAQACGLSSYVYQTRIELLNLIPGLIIFLVFSQCLPNDKECKRISYAFAAYGFLVSLFAMVQQLAGNGKLYWIVSLHQGGTPFGSYVNRSHYAGLMEMLFPLAFTVVLNRNVSDVGRGLCAMSSVAMAASVLLSQSRGGVASLCIEGLVLLVFVYGREKSWGSSLLIALLLLLAAALFVWLGPLPTLRRFETPSDPIRLQVLRDSVRMFLVHPFLGWGLGTFPDVYPQFQTFFTSKQVNHAHNDYLETLLDTGILGAGLAWAFLAQVLRRGWRHLNAWERKSTHSLRLGAAIGCIGLLVHSAFDFNLHILANAMMFFFLCALMATPPRERDGMVDGQEELALAHTHQRTANDFGS